MDFGVTAAICAALCGLIGVGSYHYFKMPQDNIVEEIAEEVIKKETGIDVDLSPESKEEKD